MKDFLILAVTALLTGLTGCVASQGNNSEDAINRDGWSLATVSGREISIERAYEVNPDCSSAGMPYIQAISGPSNGTISIKSEKVFPGYKPDNIRSKCNSQIVDGIKVYYKPNPGFIGKDRVITRLSHTNGTMYESTIDITVK